MKPCWRDAGLTELGASQADLALDDMLEILQRVSVDGARARAIPSIPAEARLQGEVERVAMIAVLDEMAKLEKVHPCVSPAKPIT